MTQTIATQDTRRVSLAALAGMFVRLGLTSFGGGTAAWVHREIIERRGWLTDEAFLSGLTVAQVLPGANPVNLALYVGLQLRGAVGAIAAVLGLLMPSFILILVLGTLYNRIEAIPATHAILGGLASVGIAVTLSVGLKLARRIGRDIVPALIAIFVFITVGVLRWPMVPLVLVVVPVSVVLAWQRARARPT